MSPILYGTALCPLLRYPTGGRTIIRVVMDTDLDLHDDVDDIVFAVRGRFGVERTPMRFSLLGTPAAWEMSAPNAITLTLAPDAADETEDSLRTLADLHEAAAGAWRIDFLDGNEVPIVRLQGDLEYLPEEGDWSDDPASTTTLPSLTVNLVNGAATVSVSLISEGGAAVTNASVIEAIEEDPGLVRNALELGTAALDDTGDFAAASHSHAIGDVTNLQTTLDGKAASSHSHGNITSAGAIGTTSGVPIRTGTAGVLQAGAFGTGAGEFAEGNHTHTLASLGIGSSNSPTFAGLTLAAGTITASTPVAITQTWNNAAVTFTGLSFNVTNTASSSSSLLADFQLDGTSRFRVARNGSPQIAGTTSLEAYSSFGGTRTWLIFDGGGGNPSMQFNQNGSINFNNASDAGGGGLNLRYGGAVGTLQLGTLNATTPTAQTIKAHNVTTGTGASLTIAGGTGSTAGGSVILATSATTGAPVAALTVNASQDITLGDGTDLILNTSTGTKVGTGTSQKLGFWNATPIVQPTTGVTAATRVAGANAGNHDDTYDGYTVAQVVKALRNAGILA